MKTNVTHENSESHRQEVKPPSERSFAITFAIVFALIGLVSVYHAGQAWPWLFSGAAAFIVLGMAAPSVLRPANRLWFKFGLVLHHVMSPLTLGFLFFVAVTPMAFFIRLSGKPLMPLQFDPGTQSYWIKRTPPGPSSESVRRQF